MRSAQSVEANINNPAPTAPAPVARNATVPALSVPSPSELLTPGPTTIPTPAFTRQPAPRPTPAARLSVWMPPVPDNQIPDSSDAAVADGGGDGRVPVPRPRPRPADRT